MVRNYWALNTHKPWNIDPEPIAGQNPWVVLVLGLAFLAGGLLFLRLAVREYRDDDRDSVSDQLAVGVTFGTIATGVGLATIATGLLALGIV